MQIKPNQSPEEFIYSLTENIKIVKGYKKTYINGFIGRWQVVAEKDNSYYLPAVHVTGDCIWELTCSGISIHDKKISSDRMFAYKKGSSDKEIAIDIINADILTSYEKNENIRLQITALPLAGDSIHYFKNEQEYMDAKKGNTPWLFLKNGEVLGLNDRNLCENTDECDVFHFTAVKGRVKNINIIPVLCEGKEQYRYVICKIGTEYGDLEIAHEEENIKEEERENMKVGATVFGFVRLSGNPLTEE